MKKNSKQKIFFVLFLLWFNFHLKAQELDSVQKVTDKIRTTNSATINQKVEDGNNQQETLDSTLQSTSMNEVVVTAYGISKSVKSVPYSVIELKGTEFTSARENNFANALSGKIAGVNVSSSSTGQAGSSRVIIRGNGSLNGNNQPLYIINDMPLDNTLLGLPKLDGFPADGIANGLNIDKGDGISGINPDDIESISVLKGGTAAALYGALASNGVIILKTKRGKSSDKIGVDYNTSFTLESPLVMTDWQYQYGTGNNGLAPSTQADAINWGRLSFGKKIDGSDVIQFDGVKRPYIAQKNNLQNFYNLGNTWTNNIAMYGGNENIKGRFSISNLNNNGIIPNSTYNRSTINASVTANLSDKIIFDVVSQYNYEVSENRAAVSDAFGNPNWGLYLIGNTIDIKNLKALDANGVEQAWNSVPIASNPWFVIEKFKKTDIKNRFLNMASITLNLNKDIYIKARAGLDYIAYKFEGIVPNNSLYVPLGGYQIQKSNFSTTNVEALAGYKKQNIFDKINLSALIGTSRRESTKDEFIAQGKDFIIPNFYSITNLSTVTPLYPYQKSAISSAFGSLDIDLENKIFLTITGRQDWFSTLSLNNNSIFYPSVGLSVILDKIIPMPSIVKFAKIRGSLAQVGGSTPSPYLLSPTYSLLSSQHNGQTLEQTSNTVIPNPNLKPLTSTTLEFGIEGVLLDNRRLSFDLTWYNRKTENDIVETSVSTASGYRTALLNAGQMTNMGIELLVEYKAIYKTNFKWTTSINGAYNKNTVEKLAENITNLVMASSVNQYVYIYSQAGRPYSTIMGRDFKRDANGNIVYSVANGVALPVAGDLKELGQGVHPLTIGFNNDFVYKNFKLSILIDGKFGGSIYSGTNLYGTRMGLTQMTLEGRENGLAISGVDAKGNAVNMINPASSMAAYYDNMKNISALFVYDASFIKLRQIILSYQVPNRKYGFFSNLKDITVSFTARNLLTLFSKTPNIDPESIITADNAQGIEQFGVPRTRSYGINLKVSF